MQDNQLEELEQTILTIYTKNINYFKKNHKQLYKDIKEFESKNKFLYSLSFENNHFEMINKDNKHTYRCDPFYDSKCRVENIEKSGKFSILKTDKEYNIMHKDYKIEANKYINEYIKIISKQKDTNSFKKFIFLGTLLGVHLNDIHAKIKAESYLIIEDNIDIFRLSMFLTDYAELEKDSKLFFSINENDFLQENTIHNYINYLPQYNNNVHFELASENEIYLIEKTASHLLSANNVTYPYSEYILSFTRGLKYFKNGIKHLNFYSHNKILESYDILFLGGGLSLQNNIEFIKHNQNKFLIVSVAANLKILEKNEIIADIIISSDSNEIILNQFDVNKKYYENSLIFLSIKTDNKVISLFNKNNIFLFNDSFELFEDTGTNTGVNVGNTAYNILLSSLSRSIYLLGFDACINEKTGKSHSTSDLEVKIKDIDLVNDSDINYKTQTKKIKGNFRNWVYTTSHFENMIKCFEELKDQKRSKIFNLSDGAYIPGSIPLKIDNIKINNNYDKQRLKENLFNQFKDISKLSFSTKDINNLKKNLSLLCKFKKMNINDLYTNFNILYNKNINNVISQILNNYFILINPYYKLAKKINEKKANNLYKSNFIEIIEYLEMRLKDLI